MTRLSKRIAKLQPYLFVEINKKIAEKKAKGIDIISFAIGDPDMPTPVYILERLLKESMVPANHQYPETSGLPELCRAIAFWYKNRFNVELNPDTEVLPLIGSKEGIGHISFCYIDENDVVLVTDPGYPVYSISTMLAGGICHFLPLKEEDGFLPNLDSIPPDIARRAKLLWLNYPNNPTGAVADIEFFNRVIQFASKNDIMICHDAPYSEVAYDGFKPPSILQAKGARERCIEFHSCSKTYNMTGWRIGMAVGNPEMVNALFKIKSNLDSGIPQAIQYMAIEALTGPQDEIENRNRIYKKRRDKLCAALKQLGISHRVPEAGFYIWVKVPEGYTSVEFVTELLDRVNIAVTPGTGYGPNGEGYVRFSITVPDERLDEGIKRLLSWKRSK